MLGLSYFFFFYSFSLGTTILHMIDSSVTEGVT